MNYITNVELCIQQCLKDLEKMEEYVHIDKGNKLHVNAAS